MEPLDIKIEYYKHGRWNAIAAMIAAIGAGIIGTCFDVNFWPYVFFVEMVGFIVWMISEQRLQTLKAIRGVKDNE